MGRGVGRWVGFVCFFFSFQILFKSFTQIFTIIFKNFHKYFKIFKTTPQPKLMHFNMMHKHLVDSNFIKSDIKYF
jgi:hypothetical protein